jgi:hypothetical protein
VICNKHYNYYDYKPVDDDGRKEAVKYVNIYLNGKIANVEA